ncbi:MAG: kelch repeat-containing protein [Saprospiraceae bacterium]
MFRIVLAICFPLFTLAQTWDTLKTTNECTARGESALAVVKGKIYLLGSRGIRPVDALDLNNLTWTALQKPPIELHHFQAVTYKNEIWVLGGLTGNYPHELPVDHIYIFNPSQNQWREGASLPNDRLRGSAGVTVYKNKIYLVSGIQDGHWDGHTPWLDEYNPKTNQWTKLADAPHARDHISVQVINNKLYVAGGRRTTAKTNNVINLKEPAVDIYDFKYNTWTTLPEASNIPTMRAGASAVAYKDQLILLGGESDTQVPAHSEVEALDTKSNRWKKLANLHRGRHGTGAVIIKNKIYIVGGAGNRGGGPELSSAEMLKLN